jgi:outer membrane murein-binding lipoprotein Lpp
MNKIILAMVIIGVLVLSGCAGTTQQQTADTGASQVTVQKADQQAAKPAEKVTEPVAEKESFCGDLKCDSSENCDSCASDCGKCKMDLFALECLQQGIGYNVKITFRNLNTEQLRTTEAYPRAVFSGLGVIDGQTKELTIDRESTKPYLYSFSTNNQITNQAKVVMMEAGKIISNEMTAVCTDEDAE